MGNQPRRRGRGAIQQGRVMVLPQACARPWRRGQGWPQALQLASQCGAAVASGKGVLAHLPRGSAWKTLRPAT